MKIDNKIVWIYWKNNISTYAKLNAEHISPAPKLIGGSITAVDAMLSNGEEQNALMPTLLGISSNSQDWNIKLTGYWNNITAEIPNDGKKLEIGFMYDIESSNKRPYIDAINKGISVEKDKLTTDEDLFQYIEGKLESINSEFERGFAEANKVTDEKNRTTLINTLYKNKYLKVVELESERYKLGTPINVEHYMLFRYCLVYRDVANELRLSDKSPNIRFYLHSEKDIKLHKEAQRKLQTDRIASFIKVTKSPTTIDNMLFALGFGAEVIKMEDVDKYIKLEDYSKDSATTAKFISIANDSELNDIANVEKYIAVNILSRMLGSSIVTDALNPSVVIGNNTKEAIAFFKDDKNKAIVSEYVNRFKAMPKA